MSASNTENSSVSDGPLKNPGPGSSQADILSILKVIDRLEIGPLRLEKRRFIAPYKVIQDGNEDTFNLEYSFEEPVFDPHELDSKNLASMIACQVAINYGLFCKEIIFNGYYDHLDQQFIREMAINTAREIYVKKFLEPNPFLIGDAAKLPVIKKESYLQAQLIFPDETKIIDSKKKRKLGSGFKPSCHFEQRWQR